MIKISQTDIPKPVTRPCFELILVIRVSAALDVSMLTIPLPQNPLHDEKSIWQRMRFLGRDLGLECRDNDANPASHKAYTIQVLFVHQYPLR